jgi:type I restriction enzyme, R subunit
MGADHGGAGSKGHVVDRKALDRDPFRSDGGYNRLNKVFNGQLEAVLTGINEELW